MEDDSDYSPSSGNDSPSSGNAPPSNRNASSRGGGEPAPDSQQRRAGFKCGKVLSDPVPKVVTCKQLNDWMSTGEVDLGADYQRDVVWNDDDQKEVIKSIWRNFYVPPLVFSTHELDDGRLVYRCIDGKQRATSIRRFMEGEIGIKSVDNNRLYYYKGFGPKRNGNRLDGANRKTFDSRELVCVIYSKITSEDERALFQRIQFGKALNRDEKWQAKEGKNARLAKAILSEMVDCGDGLASLLPWDGARARHFGCVVESIYLMEHLSVAGTRHISVDNWLDVKGAIDETQLDEVRAVFRTLIYMARDKVHSEVFTELSKKLAPVEFIMIVVMIAKYHEEISMSRLAQAIKGMRTGVRAAFKDVRNNERCKDWMYEYIKNNVTAGHDGRTAFAEVQAATAAVDATGATAAANKGRRRARRADGRSDQVRHESLETDQTAKPSAGAHDTASTSFVHPTTHTDEASAPPPCPASTKAQQTEPGSPDDFKPVIASSIRFQPPPLEHGPGSARAKRVRSDGHDESVAEAVSKRVRWANANGPSAGAHDSGSTSFVQPTTLGRRPSTDVPRTAAPWPASTGAQERERRSPGEVRPVIAFSFRHQPLQRVAMSPSPAAMHLQAQVDRVKSTFTGSGGGVLGQRAPLFPDYK